MRKRYDLWSDEDLQFLKDKHKDLYPYEIAKELNVSIGRVSAKLHKSKLRSKKCIDEEKTNNKVLEMLSEGMNNEYIQNELNVSSSRIYRISHHLVTKEIIKPIETIKIEQHPEILLLKKMKLTTFEPKYEEDERWKYKDLSPSEKVMYHNLIVRI